MVFFVVLALAAPLISPYDPIATSWAAVRKPPSAAHLFGTDELGRDVLARIIWGSRASLAAAAGLGRHGAGGRRADRAASAAMSAARSTRIVMRLIDAMLAIPFLILAIALAAFLGPSLTNAMIAIGIAQMPIFARLTRGQVLAVKDEDYIEAARRGRQSASADRLAPYLSEHRAADPGSGDSGRGDARSSPRRACPFSGSGSSRPTRAGAAC